MIRVQFLPVFRNGVTNPLLRVLGERLPERLAERGIEWDCDERSADLVWACQHRFDQRSDRPTVVQDAIDWAALNWMGRESLRQEHVRLVLKGTLYRDYALYNAPVFEDTHHGRLVLESAAEHDRPDQCRQKSPPFELTGGELQKLRLGYNWLYHPRIDCLSERDGDDSERDVDIFFADTTEYSSWHVQWHRTRVADVLESLPGRVVVSRSRSFGLREYAEMLYCSKIVVSPWGFGETCIRDLEALMAGCVLVKPETSFVRTWPEYHDADHCLTFQSDAADLAAVVGRGLEQFEELADSRRELQARLKTLRSLDVLADRVAGFVREAVELRVES